MPLIENLKIFLETSTIHGLGYWTTTKPLQRWFWIYVVLGGFTGASIIIHQSFQSWKDNPIKTTIETRPISEVKFPKISVITDETLKTAAQMFMYITAPHQIYWKDMDKLYSDWIESPCEKSFRNILKELYLFTQETFNVIQKFHSKLLLKAVSKWSIS